MRPGGVGNNRSVLLDRFHVKNGLGPIDRLKGWGTSICREKLSGTEGVGCLYRQAAQRRGRGFVAEPNHKTDRLLKRVEKLSVLVRLHMSLFRA